MADLMRSALALGWSASLCGVEETLGAFRGWSDGRQPPLDVLGSLIRRQLGLPFGLAAQAAAELTDDWVDRGVAALRPGGWRRAGGETLRQLAEATRLLTPGASGEVARRELAAKVAVWRLVKGARERLGLAAGQRFSLDAALVRVATVPRQEAAWALEGLGHDFVSLELEADPDVRGLLAGREVEPGVAAFLHAGLGLAAASAALGDLSPAATPSAANAALARFESICARNADQEFLDIARESLGLVARCFHPELVPLLDAALEREPTGLERLFWHGVGRGLYFVPSAFVPGHVAGLRALCRVDHEAPRPAARRDALAGVGYAVVFVHLGDPEVVEDLVRRAGDGLDRSFAAGARSALALRRRLDGGAIVERFVAHRPADALTRARWCRLFAMPAGETLEADDVARWREPGGEATR